MSKIGRCSIILRTLNWGVTIYRASEQLIVLIDRAGYFYARDLWEFVSGERRTECIDETSVERVRNETLQAWYFPPRLPELNPVEQCWTQLEGWFNYRLIEDLSHLQAELQIGRNQNGTYLVNAFD